MLDASLQVEDIYVTVPAFNH